jgi:ubiquinone biosynthesis protein
VPQLLWHGLLTVPRNPTEGLLRSVETFGRSCVAWSGDHATTRRLCHNEGVSDFGFVWESYPLNLASIPQLAQNANRLGEIVAILGKYGLADWINRLDWNFAKGHLHSRSGLDLARQPVEARIRLALTELGPTFIKFGQMLSTRADLVGPALATELTALQSHAPADSPEVVRALIQAELGKPVEQLFVGFEDKPVASASIGQVHRAVLENGRRVAVKVQHRGIEARIRTDLAIMMGLAELAEKYLPETRPYQPISTSDEFQRTLTRELDFSRERRNLQQFALNFEGDKNVRFPTPYPELSSSRVLTMDYLEGIPLAKVEALKQAGIDLEEMARRGAGVFLEMIFRDGFFHADPHPGNILVLPDGVIGMLDSGMVGRLDDRMRDAFEDILMAVVNRDATRLTTLITRIGSIPPELDQAALQADLTDFLYFYAGMSLDELQLGPALNQITEIVRRYHILLPPGVAMLIKVLVMLEGTSRLCNPHFNLVELMKPFQERLVLRRLSPHRQIEKLRRLADEWTLLAEALPHGLTSLIGRIQKGRFNIQLQHQHVEPAVNRLVFGMVTSAGFIGSALLLSHSVPPLLPLPYFEGQVSIPGLLACGLSGILGLRLMWAIRKSGRLQNPRE